MGEQTQAIGATQEGNLCHLSSHASGVKSAVALHRPIPFRRADTITLRSTRTSTRYRIVGAAAAGYPAAMTLAIAHPASTVVDVLEL
jgi:hypothetical protein